MVFTVRNGRAMFVDKQGGEVRAHANGTFERAAGAERDDHGRVTGKTAVAAGVPTMDAPFADRKSSPAAAQANREQERRAAVAEAMGASGGDEISTRSQQVIDEIRDPLTIRGAIYASLGDDPRYERVQRELEAAYRALLPENSVVARLGDVTTDERAEAERDQAARTIPDDYQPPTYEDDQGTRHAFEGPVLRYGDDDTRGARAVRDVRRDGGRMIASGAVVRIRRRADALVLSTLQRPRQR